MNILQISPVIIFLAELKVKMQNVMGIKRSTVNCPLNPFVRKSKVSLRSIYYVFYENLAWSHWIPYVRQKSSFNGVEKFYHFNVQSFYKISLITPFNIFCRFFFWISKVADAWCLVQVGLGCPRSGQLRMDHRFDHGIG